MDITLILQNLVSQGVLIQEGQGRWTRYGLSPLTDSVHKGVDSVHKGVDSVHKGVDSVHRLNISKVEWTTLQELAKPARENQRLPPEQMEKIILTLCKNHWLTRNQLSVLVDRNPDGLRTRFLTQMVRHNVLRLLHPDKPNRADQAYRTN